MGAYSEGVAWSVVDEPGAECAMMVCESMADETVVSRVMGAFTEAPRYGVTRTGHLGVREPLVSWCG